MEMKRIQAAIEAILFAKGESVEVKDLTEALECSEEEIRQAIDNLKTNYAKADRGIQITELENAIQLRTKEEFYDDLIKVTTVPNKQTLTDAALETLSIVWMHRENRFYSEPQNSSYGRSVLNPSRIFRR